MADTYDIGDKPVLVTTFKDEAGVLTTPATREAKYKKPDGTVLTLVPTVSSVGVLRTELPTLDQAGVWKWRVAGLTGLIAADEDQFTVEASSF